MMPMGIVWRRALNNMKPRACLHFSFCLAICWVSGAEFPVATTADPMTIYFVIVYR